MDERYCCTSSLDLMLWEKICTHESKAILVGTSIVQPQVKQFLPIWMNLENEILKNYRFISRTPNTITEERTLREELKRVRQDGYASNDEEQITGVRAVAAPIIHEDTIYGAISLSAPTSRMPQDQFKNAAPDRILDVANVIEVNIQTP